MSNKFIGNKLWALLALVTAMISIQFGAATAKHTFALIGPQGVTTLRLFFATLMLCALWRPWKQLPSRKEWQAVIFYGLALGCMNFSFYLAIARIPLGIAVALEFTGPLAIALINSRRLRDLVWVTCAAAGIVLLLPVHEFSKDLDPLGIVYALIAGLFWALYIIFGKKASNAVHGGIATSLGMGVATLITFPIGLFYAGTAIFHYSILPLALIIALFASALPYSLEMFALTKLPTRTFSILMSLEPAIATLSGLLLLSEFLGFLQWLAIGLIIIASIGSTWSTTEAERTAEIAP
jgi:inner membrane transporter RhtA